MAIEFRPALDFDLAFLADLFNRGFEGYVVPVRESPRGLAARLRFDSIDLGLSRVAMLDDRAAGILFVSVRGWHCRIAGMGVVADARRQGVGRRLMAEAIQHCRLAGLRRMVLEVIEQNVPALSLYRDLNFVVEQRLVGYTRPASHSAPTAESRRDELALAEIDPRAVSRQIAIEADPDLPWQLAAETFGSPGLGLSGTRLDDKAFALIHDPGQGALALEALLVRRRDRRSGWGGRLFHALSSRHQGRAWRIPARLPEDLAAPFFTRLGFERSPITQLQMRLAI